MNFNELRKNYLDILIWNPWYVIKLPFEKIVPYDYYNY